MVVTKKSNTNKRLIYMNFKERIMKNEYKNHITELESQNLQIPQIQTKTSNQNLWKNITNIMKRAAEIPWG